jgi:hypothetical protein
MLDPMPPDRACAALAAVVFEGPTGADGFVISDTAGGPVAFGRGAHCPIRFGHAPKPDLRLARQAGTFLVAADRVLVESSPQAGHAPVQICVSGRPPLDLPPGEAHGPAAIEYDVVVRGEREWVMRVRTRTRPATPSPAGTATDPPTERRRLTLSDHERQVLEAYVAPLRAGRLEPSTHAEVAESLSYSINKIRRDLYGIWQQMVTCGVAVPEYGDKRVAVAHAALTNSLT